MYKAILSAVGELSEAGLPTSLQKATYQFPKIQNCIRALSTPRKGQLTGCQRLGSAICPSQKKPLGPITSYT